MTPEEMAAKAYQELLAVIKCEVLGLLSHAKEEFECAEALEELILAVKRFSDSVEYSLIKHSSSAAIQKLLGAQ